MSDTLRELVFHHLTKGAGALVLLYLWFNFIRTTVQPWWKSREEAAKSETQPREFPMASLLLMVGLSAGFIYYASMEQAFRPTNSVQSEMAEQEQEKIRERVEAYEPPEPTPEEDSLQQKVDEAEARTRESNAAAKEAFSKLAPDKSDN